MHPIRLAGAAGFAAICAHAQVPPLPVARTAEPVVITATRILAATPPTLRDAVVITRDELEAAAPLTLAEVLQRLAGVEIRANGGPGQTSGVFIRGASAAQTLVLVDGLRVGSATSGATAIEAIPLEMIERIEVVKGPMSGLYGSDAIGGVVQVFTRGKSVPHLFASAAYGTDNDRRAAAGLSTADRDTRVSINAGWRQVGARSASTPRVPFGHDPDRDPHENLFATLSASHRIWTGEVLQLEAFGSRSKTSYDAGDPRDRSIQELAGARVTSSSQFLPWWSMRLTAGHTRDRQRSEGPFPSFFETRQDQAAFINEFRTRNGVSMVGVELLRQTVLPQTDPTGAEIFAVRRRDTDSYFASVNESVGGQRVEANIRRDNDDQYGHRDTGAVSYGFELARGLQATATVGRGFRVPSFNDLYLVQFRPFYEPNPLLRPERSRSTEISLKGAIAPGAGWRVTAFDNRIEDLVTLTDTSVDNIARARIRGVELTGHGRTFGVAWRGQLTLQKPRDEATGLVLRQRARRYGSFDASRTWGAWTAGASIVASGQRYDAAVPSDATRMGGYGRLDARLRYAPGKQWGIELAAVNLADRRYENALGYEGARRGALLSVRFDAF